MTVIPDFLKNSFDKYPKKTALITSKGTYTYDELYQSIVKFSSSLSKLPKQSVVSLMFENSLDFIISYFGTLNAACIAHLISPEISITNLNDQINSAEPKMIISSKKFMNKIDKLESKLIPIFEISELSTNKINTNNQPSPNDYAYLIYTSGTVSKPKGVPITHSNVDFTTTNIVNVLHYNESDVDVLPLPLTHSFGLGCMHTSFHVGSTLILDNKTLDKSVLLDLIEDNNATTLAAVPATLTTLLKDFKEKLNPLSKLRLIMTNSTSIPTNIVAELKKLLKQGKLATYYGLTEASRSTFMIFEQNIRKDDSVGKPAPGVEIKIVKNDDLQNDEGEIWIKGNNVIKNYWKNPDADNNLDTNGWLQTGDVGYIDDQEYLFVTGRKDDIINVGGEKVMPEEIERVVKVLSGIDDAIVIGMKHEIFGQVIKLLVKKSNNSMIEKTTIISHCIKNLERFKVPRKVEFVNQFPYNEYGKIKRFMLK